MNIKSEMESIFNAVKPAPPPAKKKRTLGDIYSALEAQRIWNPGLPSVPKPAPANQGERGTADALDTSGAWNKPER